MPKIHIVDGTLREGEQSPGVFFTKEEKVRIACELDRMGVTLLDVGMPSVSSEEREAIAAIARQGLKASIGVSARLKKAEIDQAVSCGAKEVFLICPVSALHISSKLGMNEREVKELAANTILYAVQKSLVTNLVAEDASRADILFLCDFLCQAFVWGVKRVFICDTVGIMEPSKMKALVEEVKGRIPPEMEIGVHCHNDLGLATANTLAAIEAGATFPTVTINGIGERAGNAPLHEVALALETLFHRDHGIDLKGIYDLSRLVEQCSGIFIPPHAPIVGFNAFRHESGIHVDGILKNSQTYTVIDPKGVGRDSAFVLGKHTGGQAITHLLQMRGYKANDEELAEILWKVKERKIAKGKAEIGRMMKEIRKHYEEALDFPMETFWEIVKDVLKKER